jgi:hypothetical protein
VATGLAEAIYYCAAPRGSAEVLAPYPGDRMILADFRLERPGKTLAGSYADSGLDEIPADLLVLRGDSEAFVDGVNKDEAFVQQVPDDQSVLCLTGRTDQDDPWPKLVKTAWARDPVAIPSVDAVRCIELRGLLEIRGAILEESDVHYVLASGSHVERYVRLRSGLKFPADADRVADWLLPQMRDQGQVLVSHRGLGTLMSSLRFQAQRRFGWNIELYDLPDYSAQSGDPHLPEHMPPRRPEDRFVIVGVDYESARENVLIARGFQDVSRVCLVDTTPGKASPSAFVHVTAERYKERDCVRCQSEPHNRLDFIDPDEEERRPHYAREPLKVTEGIIREHEEFWRRVDSSSAALVHTAHSYDDQPTGPGRRDRSVDIDVTKLLDNPEFNGDCRDELGKLPKPDCVLIPHHESATALASLATSVFGLPADAVHLVPRTGDLGNAGDAALQAATVLLLDDMIVTGTTLTRLVGRLKKRGSEDQFARLDVYGFVPLNCAPTDPDSTLVKNRFKKGSGGKSRLHEVERVLLPPPSDGCPWCKERELLERSREHLEPLHAEYLADRLAALDESPFTRVSPVTTAPDRLYGTFIGEASSTTALVAWASALQEDRARHRPADHVQCWTYLDLAHTVSSWMDWAQCAGIVRSGTEPEVRYRPHEDSFADSWEKQADQMHAAKMAEFGWAAAESKLTAGCAREVLNSLLKTSEDPALAAIATVVRLSLDASEPLRTQVASS